MNIDSLPKIIFLHEGSQQMSDRRISQDVHYDTSMNPPQKVRTKKINNTVQISEKLSQGNQINCLAYSNKLGLLVTCIQGEILITDFGHLETYMTTADIKKKEIKRISAVVQFSGKVYLSPNESSFLAVNHKEFMLFDLVNLSVISRGHNEKSLRHFIFTNNSTFIGWNFMSKAYTYQNITSTIQNPKQLQGTQNCTCVSLIKNHIIACQKTNEGEQQTESSKVLVYDQEVLTLVNQIRLESFQNTDNYLFNFTKIISVFGIKTESQGQFTGDDVYGLVLGYYDDFEEEPDRRYLNFLKGNLLQSNTKISIRGFQLFQSPNQDRSFYYGQNNQKLPFQVQVVTSGNMKIIMIQKLQTVFVVDSSSQFQDMSLYTVNPIHEIKLEGGKYFRGMCLMKNMLQKQRSPPASNSNPTCDMICKDLKGQFLSLYFPSKQTQLTVPFPATLLVLGDGKLQRKYAIQTYKGIQQYQIENIKLYISKIGKSPYISTVQNQIEVQPGKRYSLGGRVGGGAGKREVVSQVQTQVEKGMVQNKPFSLFGGQLTNKNISSQPPTKAASLFDSKPASLFGQASQSKPIQNSLFGKKTQDDKKQLKKTGLFNDNKPSMSLFGNAPQAQTNIFNSGAISGPKQQVPKIQVKNTEVQKGQPQKVLPVITDNQANSSIFRTPGGQPSIFSSNNQPKQGLNISEKGVTQEVKKVSLFDTNKQSKSTFLNQTGLFSAQNNTILGAVNDIKQNKSLFGNKQAKKQVQVTIKNEKSQQKSTIPQTKTNKNEQKPKQQVPKPTIKQQPKGGLLTGVTSTNNTGSLFNRTTENLQKQKSNTVQAKKIPKNQLDNFSKTKNTTSDPQGSKSIKIQSKKKTFQTIPQESSKVVQEDQNKINKKQTEHKIRPAKLQKLRELSSMFGHSSLESMPEPLKLLTEEQIDALIISFKSIAKAPSVEQPAIKSKQQLARQKLLKKQYLNGIVQKLQETTNYIKDIKSANDSLTSTTLFTLRNAKQLIKPGGIKLSCQSVENLEDIYSLAGLVKNYARKMEFLQKQYLACNDNQSRNANMKNNQALKRQSDIKQSVMVAQEKVNSISYYQNAIFPEIFGFLGQKLTYEEYEQKWISAVTKKSDNSAQLMKKVKILIEQIQQIIPIPSDKSVSERSVSTVTNLSMNNNKKKGYFAFTLDSSSSSSDQAQPIQKLYIEQKNHNSQIGNRKVMIKFKPKNINLKEQARRIKPLVNLQEQQLQSLAQVFLPSDLFRVGNSGLTSLLQSSVRKSVNFKDKIPLRKNGDEVEREGIKRIDHSQSQGYSENQRDDSISNGSLQALSETNFPDMIGRSISLVQKPLISTAQNPMKPLAQNTKATILNKATDLIIKKTVEKDITDDKISILKQTQKAVNVFGGDKKAQQQKCQPKKDQKPKNVSLFGNLSINLPATSGSLFGNTNITQKKQVVVDNKNKLQVNKQQIKAKVLKDDEKQLKTSLFGTGNSPTGSLFGGSNSNSLFGNTNTKPTQNKQKQIEKSKDAGVKIQTKDQVKQKQTTTMKTSQPKAQKVNEKSVDEKKPSPLFGNTNSNKVNLFGNVAGLGIGNNKQEGSKKQETTKASQISTKQTSLFGSSSSFTNSLTGGVLGQSVDKKPQQSKEKISLKPVTQSVEAKKPQISVTQATNSVPEIQKSQKIPEIAADNISPTVPKKQVNIFGQIKPQFAPQMNTGSLFGNQNTSPIFGGNTSHQVPTFGAQNRFLAPTAEQAIEKVANQGFNPNQGSFTGGFSQNTGGGLKSFSSFNSNNQGPSMFTQSNQQQNPSAGNMTGSFQNQLFGNQPQQNNPLQNQQTSMFGQQIQPNTGGIFSTNQPSGDFLNTNSGNPFNQNTNINSNFLSKFNPSTSNNPPPAINNSMMKPRK